MATAKAIRVDGEAIGKARPRATLAAGHIKTYTPSKSKDFEFKVAEAYRKSYGNIPPSTKPIEVCIEAHFPLLKGDYRKNGEPNKRGQAKLDGTEKPTKKPDIDNLAKSVLDGLNKIAWVDDTQVVKLWVAKTYSLEAYTIVTIIEMD